MKAKILGLNMYDFKNPQNGQQVTGCKLHLVISSTNDYFIGQEVYTQTCSQEIVNANANGDLKLLVGKEIELIYGRNNRVERIDWNVK